MRGRKPKPTSLKVAEGDKRKIGKHKLDEKLAKEPKPMRGFPDCPPHLKGVAREAWEFLSEQIAAMEQDHRPDAIMLEGACVNYARAVQADTIIHDQGLTYIEYKLTEDEDLIPIKVRPRPEIAISNAAWLRVRAFCSEFGLSPVSRTRLSLEKADTGEEDKLREILSKPREAKVPPPVIH